MRENTSQNIVQEDNALEVVASKWGVSLVNYFEGKSEVLSIDNYAEFDAEFANWLGESVLHRVEILRFINAWKKADNFGSLKSPFFNEPSNNRRKIFRRFGWGFGIAASFLFVSGIAINLTSAGSEILPRAIVSSGVEGGALEYVYQTQVGSFEDVRLPDGTIIKVNSDTQLKVQMGEGQRLVTLDKGEAFFDVAKDEERPFVVLAGDRIITVLGTRFSVHHQDVNLEIAVEEGLVKVADSESKDGDDVTLLKAGDVVLADPYSGERAVKVAEADINFVMKELSWRDGYVVFDGHTVSQAVAEFNRYNLTKMVYLGSAGDEIRISGRFSSQNISGFTGLLSDGFGYQVRSESEKIIISQKP